jgi:hypothetical protein
VDENVLYDLWGDQKWQEYSFVTFKAKHYIIFTTGLEWPAI